MAITHHTKEQASTASHLQEQLALVRMKIAAKETELKQIEDSKSALAASYQSGLADVERMNLELVQGTDEPDLALVSWVDKIRQDAIGAIAKYVAKIQPSSS